LALEHNLNSRSRSRSRRRSHHSRFNSRTRNGADVAKADRAVTARNQSKIVGKNMEEQVRSELPQAVAAMVKQQLVSTQKTKMDDKPKETPSPSPTTYYIANTAASTRGPIMHPQYTLGDSARDEDMIVFPKRKKSRLRRRRRRLRNTHKSQEDSGSDSNGEMDEGSSSRSAHISMAIGQLRHLDAAFVRRSDGSWTYAIVADGNDTEIRFVINNSGSTKSFPRSNWDSNVRRIRVLSERQGDKVIHNKRRKIQKSRSFQGKETKGLMVLPSPTRRNYNVLSLPPTISENKYAQN